MEVTGKLHSPAALHQREKPRVPVGKDASWAPQWFCQPRRRHSCLCHCQASSQAINTVGAAAYYYYWSEDRIPVGGEIFRTVQTGLGAHPASCTVGTGSFSGVKRSGRSVGHSPTPSSAEVKERIEPYLFSPSGPSWPVIG